MPKSSIAMRTPACLRSRKRPAMAVGSRHEDGFGDLDHEGVGIQARAVERTLHVLHQIAGFELQGRGVDRDAHEVAGVVPEPGLAAGLCEHPPTDLHDHPRGFEGGDELHGRDDPACGVPPAEQGLHTFGPMFWRSKIGW